MGPARALDLALGASAASWAVLGVARGPSVPALTLAVLNALVARAFFVRRAPLSHVGLGQAGLCLLSAALGGVALRLAPEGSSWPTGWALLFALGGACAVFGLASLGRSFAVLPSVRGLVARGAYRWVRHPMYLGEFVMVAAAAGAGATPASYAVAGAALGLGIVRIRVEERLLCGACEYKDYARAVPWRLIPGMW